MARRFLQELLSSQLTSTRPGSWPCYSLAAQKRFLTSRENIQPLHDVEPRGKAANDNPSLVEVVDKDVRENPVMVYIKGSPDHPRCGFSALAVKILQLYGVSFCWRSIADDEHLKKSIKSYTFWPTFPQVFIKGQFVGGSDILLSMHQSGELKEMLKDLINVSK